MHLPAEALVCQIVQPYCALEDLGILHSPRDPVLVVAESQDLTGFVVWDIAPVRREAVHRSPRRFDVVHVAPPLEGLLALVVGTERRHIGEVPNTDDHVRALRRDVLADPVKVFRRDALVYLAVGDDEVGPGADRFLLTAPGRHMTAMGGQRRDR